MGAKILLLCRLTSVPFYLLLWGHLVAFTVILVVKEHSLFLSIWPLNTCQLFIRCSTEESSRPALTCWKIVCQHVNANKANLRNFQRKIWSYEIYVLSAAFRIWSLLWCDSLYYHSGHNLTVRSLVYSIFSQWNQHPHAITCILLNLYPFILFISLDLFDLWHASVLDLQNHKPQLIQAFSCSAWHC